MRKKIDLMEVDPLAFVGIGDKNIKVIESQFDSKITVRGNSIILDGSVSELQLIQSIFNDMIEAIHRKSFVDSDDVKSLINLAKSGENYSDVTSSDGMPIVLHTHQGAISARTEGQKQYHNAVQKNDIVFAVGPAGTGKTYQAVASGVAALKRKEVERIVITRPAVEAGERLGFLPGDLKDKVDPYLTPLYDALNDMIPREKLKVYLDQRTIEVAPLAYMRGRTLHNAFMILDEAQNATRMQMKMFLTRLGVTSKAIITGDITQIDLPPSDSSGLIEATSILKSVDGIDFIFFDENDVVRHRLVKDIIKAYAKKTKVLKSKRLD